MHVFKQNTDKKMPKNTVASKLQEELIRINRHKIENQKLSLREFSAGKTILNSKPSKLMIDLTENCNLKCIFCTQSYHPKYKKNQAKLDMKLNIFNKISKELFPSAYFIDLSGTGESTAMPIWPEILSMLDEYPLINWHILSNLSIINNLIWERMVDKGFLIGFSIDAASKSSFEKIRTLSSFDNIMNNLDLIVNSIQSVKKGHIYFVTTVHKSNIEELPEIVRLAKNTGVKEVQFKSVRQVAGLGLNKERILKSQIPALIENLKKSIEISIDTGVRLTINDNSLLNLVNRSMAERATKIPYESHPLNFPLNDKKELAFLSKNNWDSIDKKVKDKSKVSLYKTCFKPFHFSYLDIHGNVGPCNHLSSPDLPIMGNISESSFSEIWNNREYVNYRKNFINSSYPHYKCSWCFVNRMED